MPKDTVSPQAEELCNQVNNLIANGDLSQARAILERLTRHYSNFEKPFRQLALIELADGNIEQAKSLAKYLILLNENYIDNFELLAGIAAKENNYQQALQYLESYLLYRAEAENLKFKFLMKIIHEGPPPDECPENLDAQSYYELGQLYHWYGPTEIAREAFKRSIEADSQGIFAKKSAQFIKKRLPLSPLSSAVERQFKDALKILELRERAKVLIKLFAEEKSEIIGFEIAETFYTQEKYDIAIDYLEICLDINPLFYTAKRCVVDLLCLNDQWSEALDFMDGWIEQEPEDLELERLKATIEMRFGINYQGSPTAWKFE